MTKINKELREELKKLSENSTLLCDELQKKQLKKKKEKKPVDEGFQLMLKEKEISNTDKQMKNLMNEYAMVKKRIEKVSNYNYTVDLKNKLAESEEEIKNN